MRLRHKSALRRLRIVPANSGEEIYMDGCGFLRHGLQDLQSGNDSAFRPSGLYLQRRKEHRAPIGK